MIHAPPFAAKLTRFALPAHLAMDATVVVPAVRGTWWLRYGEHAYYVMDLQSLEGMCVTIPHGDIIRRGFSQVLKAACPQRRALQAVWRWFSERHHYGFTGLEQIMMMTVPHTITPLHAGRFIVNLWAYPGYIDIDCRGSSVTWRTVPGMTEHEVLGAQQWYVHETHAIYALLYSLSDSFARIADPKRPVSCRIVKYQPDSTRADPVWQGELGDFMHDLLVNPTGRYCVSCELGMHTDARKHTLPSRVLILDLTSGKTWRLDRFTVAAHAQFDPLDPEVIYFSNHNFQFVHSSPMALLKRASYGIEFRGPASIFKYRLTPEGPVELGAFSRPDFFRLTNMHVFMHRGNRLMAAMGFPDTIFLIDPETMAHLRIIRVKDPVSIRYLYSRQPALIGTFCPSPDGERLFVHTSRSFQVVDVETGAAECVRESPVHHTCSNHMLAVRNTDWPPP